jgi:hypothetical protein
LVCFPSPFEVSSFFDVFAEISFDGENWTPSNGALRIVQGIPEPAGLLWLAIAAWPASLLRRRR